MKFLGLLTLFIMMYVVPLAALITGAVIMCCDVHVICSRAFAGIFLLVFGVVSIIFSVIISVYAIDKEDNDDNKTRFTSRRYNKT